MGPLVAAQAVAAGGKILGSVLGGIGAKKRADAIKKAIKYNIKDVKKFTTDQLNRSDKLGAEKQTYLEEGDPFTEMGRFIFGDPSQDTFANLRKSQSDFAQLAAGKTDNFSREVSSIVQGALANTFGGPRGSFENLSAKNLMSFRQSGLQSALGLTDFFNRTGSQLTNAKFGILDQTFERQLGLRQNQLNQINSLRLGKAQQSGVGWMAAGNVANAVGGAASNVGSFLQNETALAEQKAFNTGQLDIMRSRQQQSQPYYYQQPSYYTPAMSPPSAPMGNPQSMYQMPMDNPLMGNPYLNIPYSNGAGGFSYASPATFADSPVSAYINGAPSLLPPVGSTAY